jgi:TATA-binding protein-associated factor Taf7
MSSKKKLKKGIETIEELLKAHEKKLAEAGSEELKGYFFKDIQRLRKQKEKKEKQLEK